jgi:1-acyl-sn-glycerol-3-phosphate acyltransferase
MYVVGLVKKIIFRFLQIVYSIYALLLFLIIMILVVPVVILISFLNKEGREISVMKLARLWADVWLFMVGIRHVDIVEQPIQEHRSYIFISNHNSYMDIPELLKAIRLPLRVLGKAEMGTIPVFGWIYNAAVVPVWRDSPEGRLRSLMMLREVLRKEISIFIAPEGTFNMTGKPLVKFFDGAFRLSIETQTPIKPLLFLDASDRLHWSSIFSLTPGRLRTVYLPEISPESFAINQIELYKQFVYTQMEEKLLEYRASWIREDETASSAHG